MNRRAILPKGVQVSCKYCYDYWEDVLLYWKDLSELHSGKEHTLLHCPKCRGVEYYVGESDDVPERYVWYEV